MRSIFLLLALGILPLQVFAKANQDCQELKAEQIRLALTASNLSNVNTTRTPEGGPYKPFTIKSCSNGSCDVARNKSPLLRYLPDHPDANENGYVAFPFIDQKDEYATFNMTAAKLKLLVANKACGSKVLIDNGKTSVALRYPASKKIDIKEDIFNFDNRQQVVSWMREDLKGATSVVNFASNGDVISHSEGEQ